VSAPKTAAEIVSRLAYPPASSELDDRVIVRIMNRQAFLTLTQGGHRKRIYTDRAGLEYIRDQIDAALELPMSNVNGIPSGNIRD
jgi:hypothetical protein